MPLGGMALISLFYAFAGVRFLWSFWPVRKDVFDANLTERERSQIAQVAFFVLLPISVALHELGHAIAIWLMGGEVLGFGYYFFAGYVEYDPSSFTDAQMVIIAFAGTFVNLLLIAIALLVVFRKSPPLLAAWNELLLEFVFISGINALVFYPLLDLATGMGGDWSQMYRGGVPVLTGIIIAIQAGCLALAYWASKSHAVSTKLADLTGYPPGVERPLVGKPRVTGTPVPAAAIGNLPSSAPAGMNARTTMPATPDEAAVQAAMERVASGWPVPVRGQVTPGPNGQVTSLAWVAGGLHRAVGVNPNPDGSWSLVGVARPASGPDGGRTEALQTWLPLPGENELTFAIRLGMEQVDRWVLATG